MKNEAKKSVRLNLIDYFLLLVIAAAIAGMAYIYLNGGGGGTGKVELEYTIEVSMVKNELLPEIGKWKAGDSVTESARVYALGTVVSVELEDAYILSADMDAGIIRKEYYPKEPGFSRVKLTVRVEAERREGIYYVNGNKLAVGLPVHFRTPWLVGSGYYTGVREI